MKHIKFLSIMLLLGALFTGCKDKVEEPMWIPASNPEYAVNMTAVVSVVQPTNVWKNQNDKVGAFINGECRGIGVIMGLKDKAFIYFVSIIGSSNEQQDVSFQYFSSEANYTYKSKKNISFEPDKIYGTVDSPVLLEVKK